MLAAVAATLSLAASLTIALDVPFLPQTDALCGGAAAAMVFRYWGDAHAGVEQFAPLVDRRAGGIADAVLVDAIARRGWRVDRFEGSLATLDERLRDRAPIIVLLSDRGSRYHYVVVVGRTADAVVVHDPSWGPSRAMPEADFLKRWEASSFWALVVRPAGDPVRLKADTTDDEARSSVSTSTVASGFSRTEDECASSVDRAVAELHDRGLDAADAVFEPLVRQCPRSAAPLRELAGVRFAQRRWREAAAFARRALERDPHDAYALDVLGSSLFMADDPVAALRAWNQLGKPTLDRVRISGLRHSRYQAINDALDLTPGVLLTGDAFARARRRLEELPDRATARIDVRPDADGYATVDVVVAERSLVPRSAADWAPIGLGAAVDREASATLPGFTGEGEVWTASWRWWANRPRAAVGFAAPRVAGLPGVWRVDASWEVQSYSIRDSSSFVRESRAHAGVSVSDWLGADWRYQARTGFDEWDGGRRAMSVGGAVERRLWRDRVSLAIDGETWATDGSVPPFSAATLRGQWSSPPVAHGWASAASAGIQHVTTDAPLALWPGAGDGRARGELLRAHPMLDDGVINLNGDSAFGRTLVFGTAEAQRWIDTRWPARVGVALFTDAARAADRFAGADVMMVDVGAGLRLRIPGVNRVLRIDAAHGLRDGANAVTVGWTY